LKALRSTSVIKVSQSQTPDVNLWMGREEGLSEKSANLDSANAGFDLFDDERDDERRLNASVADASDFIVDIREWDVPYHVRVMIDQSGSHQHELRMGTDICQIYGRENGTR
jgi:DNA polymerase elongation subunit (family B)